MTRQLQDIAREFACRRTVEAMALATLVRTTGSSYLRPGAQMLITASGRTFGLLSGGCIEEEVAARAREVLRRGESCVLHFDTRLRFGCSGSLEIFVEPLDAGNTFLLALGEALRERRSFLGATVFASSGERAVPTGSRALDPGGTGSPLDAALAAAVIAGAGEANEPEFREPSTLTLALPECSGATVSLLLQPVFPPLRLVIAGGGLDGVPLRGLARSLGWQVTTLCEPDEPAAADPGAVRWSAEQLPSSLRADGRTAAVVMTHHYGRDFAWLRAFLPLGLRYLGLVGSRKRKEQLAGALLDLGADLSATAAIHGPAGADIGAESPEEIALSIVAEIQAIFAGRACFSLRDRKGPLHRRGPAATATAATAVATTRMGRSETAVPASLPVG